MFLARYKINNLLKWCPHWGHHLNKFLILYLAKNMPKTHFYMLRTPPYGKTWRRPLRTQPEKQNRPKRWLNVSFWWNTFPNVHDTHIFHTYIMPSNAIIPETPCPQCFACPHQSLRPDWQACLLRQHRLDGIHGHVGRDVQRNWITRHRFAEDLEHITCNG